MVENQNIEKLKDVRDKLATVFKSEVTDDVYDNGLLNTLTSAIVCVENAITVLGGRVV